MKRAVIVHPYRHVGGPDTFVTNVVKILRLRGWQAWVVVGIDRPLSAVLRGLGATVVVVPELSTLPRSLSPLHLVSYLARTRKVTAVVRDLVERHAINVVHGVHETMWSVLRGLRRTGAGLVVSVHGLRFASPAWAGRVNTRLLAGSADRIICVSQVVRQVFRGWGVTDEQLSLMPSSVDLDRFSPGVSGDAVRRELGIPLDAVLAGTVGSIDERKGQVYFVDACGLLRRRNPLFRAVVVGHTEGAPAAPGSYLDLLRARSSALELDGCLQFVPARSDVPAVMAALDVLVQPSLTEAGPRAPLEAMAMSRPVVGTRVGAIPEEVVEGETALLVPPADAASLADAISRLIDAPHLRAELGRAGRKRVERHFSLTATAETVERVYDEAAARADRRRTS